MEPGWIFAARLNRRWRVDDYPESNKEKDALHEVTKAHSLIRSSRDEFRHHAGQCPREPPRVGLPDEPPGFQVGK